MKEIPLLKHREIFFFEDVSDESALKLITQLHFLEFQNYEPIYIYINSLGGYVDDAWGIIDTIRNCKSEIYIIVYGSAYSAAALILLAGDYRYSTEHSLIMFHSGEVTFESTPLKETQSYIKMFDEMEKKYITQLVDRLGIPKTKLTSILKSGEYLTPDKAKKLKLINGIWTGKK